MINFSFNNQVIRRSYSTPVIVEFSSEGCGPCLWVENQIIEIHREDPELFEFISIPVSQYPDVIELYKIHSNPTLMIFINGEHRASLSGALPRIAIVQWIQDHIN